MTKFKINTLSKKTLWCTWVYNHNYSFGQINITFLGHIFFKRKLSYSNTVFVLKNGYAGVFLVFHHDVCFSCSLPVTTILSSLPLSALSLLNG